MGILANNICVYTTQANSGANQVRCYSTVTSAILSIFSTLYTMYSPLVQSKVNVQLKWHTINGKQYTMGMAKKAKGLIC